MRIDAEAGRGVALRVEIDDQHVLADGGERRAEIDRGRGLADAALLVGEREHARSRVIGSMGRSWPASCGRIIVKHVQLLPNWLTFRELAAR